MMGLYVEAPFCFFRMPLVRGCMVSYPVPPPSTIYGFLLSLVGETDRNKYIGCQLTFCLISKPTYFSILRRVIRRKNKDIIFGEDNRKPETTQSLHGLSMALWVSHPELEERISWAMEGYVRRFGVLSLGESQNIVNQCRILRGSDFNDRNFLITSNTNGYMSLPVWVDYVNPGNTTFRQFIIEEKPKDFFLKDFSTLLVPIQP